MCECVCVCVCVLILTVKGLVSYLPTTERTRETLLHEMCHAAVWLIDRKRDGHGPFWKAWWVARHCRYWIGIDECRHSCCVVLQFPDFVQSGAGSWANRPDQCTVCVCIGGWTSMNVLY